MNDMESEVVERKFGTVIFFSAPKGYGFIAQADGGSELFTHFSAVMMSGYRKLDQGDEVSYELGSNHKGPCAVNVVVERKA